MTAEHVEMRNAAPRNVAGFAVDEVGRLLTLPKLRAVVISLFGLGCLVAITRGGPLGWDESVYAARAGDLVDSNFVWAFRSGSYWSDVRAPGLSIVQSGAFRVFGASDLVARIVVAAFGVGLLALMGWTLDLWFERRVGTTAILLTALAPGFMATSSLSFADIPAMFFATLSVYLLGRALLSRRDGWLALVPLALGVATTIRFGAVLLVLAPLCVVGIAAAVELARERDWQRSVHYVLAGSASVAVVVALLGTRALTTTASPLAATRAAGELNAFPEWNWLDDLRTILTPGQVDYGFDAPFWGFPYAAIFASLGVVAVARLVVLGHFRLLGLCSFIVLTPVLLYAVTVNQFVTTYLAPIFATVAAMVAVGLWANGIRTIDEPVGRDPRAATLPSRWVEFRPLLAVGLSVTVLAVFLVSVRDVVDMQQRLSGFDQLAAASVIADDLLGPGCRVATLRTPQVSWYSDCSTRRLAGPVDSGVSEEFLAALASQTGGRSGDVVGLVLLEGLSGQISIESVWDSRVEDSSVLLTGPTGRKTAVVAIELP